MNRKKLYRKSLNRLMAYAKQGEAVPMYLKIAFSNFWGLTYWQTLTALKTELDKIHEPQPCNFMYAYLLAGGKHTVEINKFKRTVNLYGRQQPIFNY